MTDFDRLSEAQIEALSSVAFGMGGQGASQRTLKSLSKKGLIEPVENESADRFGVFRWTTYVMPIPVHIAFCQWCEDNADLLEASQ